jgi:hypothetical protein
MTWITGKDLEGSGSDVTEVYLRIFLKDRETHENPHSE